MVHYMDVIVGRLVNEPKELGLEDKTLVIFTGDNGTAGNLVSQMGAFHLRGGKRTMNEAGTRATPPSAITTAIKSYIRPSLIIG
jgi:arylsulfatase A-like enzyme